MDVTPFSKLTILKQIGHGGFGDVYHARHRDWSEVAYKKLVVSFIRPTERSVVQMSLYGSRGSNGNPMGMGIAKLISWEWLDGNVRE